MGGRTWMEFSWQEGYGAFSVSKSNINAVVKYIANQETHDRRITLKMNLLLCWTNTGSNMIQDMCRRLRGFVVSQFTQC